MEAGERLAFGKERDSFMGRLRRDVAFLSKHKLMDYSLLVAIHNCGDEVRACVRVGGGEGEGVVLRVALAFYLCMQLCACKCTCAA